MTSKEIPVRRRSIRGSEFAQLSATGGASALRTIELEALMHGFRAGQFRRGLEIGCGTGHMSHLLARYCGSLVSSDADSSKIEVKRGPKHSFIQLDAQNMSVIEDHSFDFVFSSHVLQHLPRLSDALAEINRVLVPGGIAVHSVANNVWKFFNILLFYPSLADKAIQLVLSGPLRNSNSTGTDTSRCMDDNMQPLRRRRGIQRFLPRPLGWTNNHIREWMLWRDSVWQSSFYEHGFSVFQIVRLPFYYGHGYRFKPLYRLGNKIGLSASTGYLMKKVH